MASVPMARPDSLRERLPAGIVMTDLAHKCVEYVRINAIDDAKDLADLRVKLSRIYPEAAEIENEWWGAANNAQS